MKDDLLKNTFKKSKELYYKIYNINDYDLENIAFYANEEYDEYINCIINIKITLESCLKGL